MLGTGAEAGDRGWRRHDVVVGVVVVQGANAAGTRGAPGCAAGVGGRVCHRSLWLSLWLSPGPRS